MFQNFIHPDPCLFTKWYIHYTFTTLQTLFYFTLWMFWTSYRTWLLYGISVGEKKIQLKIKVFSKNMIQFDCLDAIFLAAYVADSPQPYLLKCFQVHSKNFKSMIVKWPLHVSDYYDKILLYIDWDLLPVDFKQTIRHICITIRWNFTKKTIDEWTWSASKKS